MWCASDNHSNTCHICTKELLDLTLSSYLQNINFGRNCPKCHIIILKNHNFSSIIGTSYTNCFYPINVLAGTCQEYSFSFLPVVSR